MFINSLTKKKAMFQQKKFINVGNVVFMTNCNVLKWELESSRYASNAY